MSPYVTDWLAFIVKQPAQKTKTALVLIGPPAFLEGLAPPSATSSDPTVAIAP
jgi:hypothetical protein